MRKWDIDWKKLGHPEPKVLKTTYPQQGIAPTFGEAGSEAGGEPSVSVLDANGSAVGAKDSSDVVLLHPSDGSEVRKSAWPGNIIRPGGFGSDEDYGSDDMNNDNHANEETDMLASKERLSDTAVPVMDSAKSKLSSIRESRTEKLRETPASANNSTRRRGRDLQSGMELLELDFLLGVVENTGGDEGKDVTMRKLIFRELLRRQQIHEIDSNALKIYALNDNDLYGKEIQVEAMKELFERTTAKR